MEPNNIENQIREKLNSREIQPSSQAWDRLDTMLSVAKTHKPKLYFNWFAIAASIIVFVTLGILFFNENTNESNSIKSVVIENKVPKTSSEKVMKIANIEVVFIKKGLKKSSINLVQTKSKSNINGNINSNFKNQIGKNEDEIASVIQPNIKIEPIENQVKLNYTSIDDLLASVEKKSETVTKKLVIKINSAALLNEVDGELELTFREKALNTINKKYNEAKVALANRNNQ